MSWVSDLIKGRNGKVSLMKSVAWAFGAVTAIQTGAPDLFHHSVYEAVDKMLLVLGIIAGKNAIDKSAPTGSPAAPHDP